MTELLQLYEAEQGEPCEIKVKNEEGNPIDISWAVPAESKIEVKDIDDNVILTMTSSTFTITTPNVIWTPTSAQLNTLTKEIVYTCFIHLTKLSTNRVKIARFLLKKLNN